MNITLKMGAKEFMDDNETACYKGWLLRRMVPMKVEC